MTSNNVTALIAIQNQEGGHQANGARFNPLNTMREAPGGKNAIGKIKAYSSWDEGVRATAATLAQSNMRSIVQSLARSAPPEETLKAFADSPWGWYDPKTGVRLPYPAALAVVRSPSLLSKYGSMAYRGGDAMFGWVSSELSLPLPLWSGALAALAGGVLGSQLARGRPLLGAGVGVLAASTGWFAIGKIARG